MNLLPLSLILTFCLMPPLPEGRVSWTPAFPLAIPGTGSAIISGRARAEPGFTLVAAKVTYFEDGDQATTRYIPISKNGIVGPAIISGLTPGKRYTVEIEVAESRGGQNETLATVSWVIAR